MTYLAYFEANRALGKVSDQTVLHPPVLYLSRQIWIWILSPTLIATECSSIAPGEEGERCSVLKWTFFCVHSGSQTNHSTVVPRVDPEPSIPAQWLSLWLFPHNHEDLCDFLDDVAAGSWTLQWVKLQFVPPILALVARRTEPGAMSVLSVMGAMASPSSGTASVSLNSIVCALLTPESAKMRILNLSAQTPAGVLQIFV